MGPRPKGVLGLGHANIISMLLCFVPGLFCLFLGLLSLSLSHLDLLQLLLQGDNLLLEGSQLVFGITQKQPLALGLPLHRIQGSGGTFPLLLLFLQLDFQLIVTLFSHMEGVHNCNPSPLFLLHFAVRVVHHLLGPKGGLDGLKGMADAIKKKKKNLT